MDVGAGLYMYVYYDVVIKTFTFVISSPDEFLLMSGYWLCLDTCLVLALSLSRFMTVC